MTAFEFKSLMTTHLLLYGNAFAFVERLGKKPVYIWPLRPDKMKVVLNENGTLNYEYGKQTYSADQIIHFRVFSLDGVEGLSPISCARNAIGLSLQMEKFSSNLYKNGAKPAGMLKHPGSLTPEAAKRLQESFSSQYAGTENAGKLMLLEDGISYEATSMSPADAEFIATRRFGKQEIATLFGVPTHLIGENDKPTYASVESEKDSFLSFTIRPYLNAIEQTLDKALFAGSDYYSKFTIADFLRSNIETRYKAYSVGIQNGFLSANEVRAMEERNDRPGGDVFLTPLNMRELTTETTTEITTEITTETTTV